MIFGNLFNRIKKRRTPPQEWVDLIFTPGTPAERIPLETIISESQIRVDNCNRIMNDCLRIMKKTTNIDTFFTRYALFDEQLHFLVRLEPFLDFEGQRPTDLQEAALNAREETIELFLRVEFNKLWDIAQGASSLRVKLNRINKYKEKLGTYHAQIPENIFNQYTHKCEKLIQKLHTEKDC